MKRHIIFLSLASILLIPVLAGCKKGLSDFIFSYTMESVDNYKMVLTVGSDRTYKIEISNYFQAKYKGELIPEISEGNLTNDEIDTFSRLLAEADLFSMKDSYGFGKDAPATNIMYQVYLQTDGKDKYISIQNSKTDKVPVAFLQLLEYINVFTGEHRVE